MRCPHCNYRPELTLKEAKCKYEKFYNIPIKAERAFYPVLRKLEYKEVYACPACRKLFIEE